jgi:hypothetical protein
MSAKIQVVFYSMYGHIYQLAEAVSAGARETGADVSLLAGAGTRPRRHDSPLEGIGFELSVPRGIASAFEASPELGPIDKRRGVSSEHSSASANQ